MAFHDLAEAAIANLTRVRVALHVLDDEADRILVRWTEHGDEPPDALGNWDPEECLIRDASKIAEAIGVRLRDDSRRARGRASYGRAKTLAGRAEAAQFAGLMVGRFEWDTVGLGDDDTLDDAVRALDREVQKINAAASLTQAARLESTL